MTWYASNKRNIRILLKQDNIRIYIYSNKNKQTNNPASSQLKSELFLTDHEPQNLGQVLSEICVVGCMQSLINFQAARRVPVRLLLLQNNWHDQGFRECVYHLEGKNTTGRQIHSPGGLQRFEITTIFAVQHPNFCYSSCVRSSLV